MRPVKAVRYADDSLHDADEIPTVDVVVRRVSSVHGVTHGFDEILVRAFRVTRITVPDADPPHLMKYDIAAPANGVVRPGNLPVGTLAISGLPDSGITSATITLNPRVRNVPTLGFED